MEAAFDKAFLGEPWDNAQAFAELAMRAGASSANKFFPKFKAAWWVGFSVTFLTVDGGIHFVLSFGQPDQCIGRRSSTRRV